MNARLCHRKLSLQVQAGSFLESAYEIIEPLGFYTHQLQVQLQVRRMILYWIVFDDWQFHPYWFRYLDDI
jgi:hypothetical protein